MVSGGYSLVVVCGLLIAVGSLVAEHGLQGSWAFTVVAQPQWFWSIGLVALQHMESSWTRYQTHVPCLAGGFLCSVVFATPWTVTRQVPLSMGFSRQQSWGGLPFPISRDSQGSNPLLLCLLRWQADSLPLSHLGSPFFFFIIIKL